MSNGKKTWEFGKTSHLIPDELRTILSKSANFWVTNETAEDHMKKTVMCIEEYTCDCCATGIISNLLRLSLGDEEGMTKDLLALGLNPDFENRPGRRPAHHCGRFCAPKCAEVLGVCRPDLQARDELQHRPVDEASIAPSYQGSAKEQCRKIEDHWGALMADGFPWIAELAQQKKWWALKSLCRRRVVWESEKFAPFRGKNAIEWTEYHGEHDHAAELRYFLLDATSNGIPTTVLRHGVISQPIDARMFKTFTDEVKSEMEALKEGLFTVAMRLGDSDRGATAADGNPPASSGSCSTAAAKLEKAQHGAGQSAGTAGDEGDPFVDALLQKAKQTWESTHSHDFLHDIFSAIKTHQPPTKARDQQ